MNYLFFTYKALFQLLKSKISILFTVIAAFLLPIQPLLILVGFMILLDTATGLWKANRLGERITSHKLSRIISKMVLYQVGVITFFVLEKYLLSELIQHFVTVPFFLTKVVAVVFVGIELQSMNENIEAVTGINFFGKFKKMLFRVKEIKNDINEVVNN